MAAAALGADAALAALAATGGDLEAAAAWDLAGSTFSAAAALGAAGDLEAGAVFLAGAGFGADAAFLTDVNFLTGNAWGTDATLAIVFLAGITDLTATLAVLLLAVGDFKGAAVALDLTAEAGFALASGTLAFDVFELFTSCLLAV